ncbi:hypothetical protein P5673_019816 [Acropora cervicornis]|uniref:Uncharacterized protein n=1 Tax=Acropora cervicornis TaxID=6130 RepID=A0AAD9QAX1_ACRCE|nr:hypothetical protein P5673_019816 [Acropora cervicornis]
MSKIASALNITLHLDGIQSLWNDQMSSSFHNAYRFAHLDKRINNIVLGVGIVINVVDVIVFKEALAVSLVLQASSLQPPVWHPSSYNLHLVLQIHPQSHSPQSASCAEDHYYSHLQIPPEACALRRSHTLG